MPDVYTPTDARARIADWVELRALVRSPYKVTSAQVINAVGIIDDPVRDVDDEDRGDDPEKDEDLRGDRGILNAVGEELSQRIFDELWLRQDVLGEDYPFEVAASGVTWTIQAKNASSSDATELARSFYRTALLISAVRYDYVSLDEHEPAALAMPELLQIMSVIVAAEYVNGEAFWMGWPRPSGAKDFTSALSSFIAQIQIGRLADDNTAYDPAVTKDGTVDLIAWRSFRDGKPGKTVLYGQVASGKNWRTKPLKATYDPHFAGWFQGPGPSNERMFSLFIPFMRHESCKPRRTQSYDALVLDTAVKDERAMGIIFDRFRITELAAAAHARIDALSRAGGVSYAALLEQLAAWQANLLASAGGANL